MNGVRRPRQVRVTRNPIQHAKMHAAKYTPTEVRQMMAPVYAALTALREGVANEMQWMQLASSVNVAKAIEKRSVVHGLSEHLASAELALKAIELRAKTEGRWKAVTLYFHELDNVTAAINLHRYQLLQLSYGELKACVEYARAEIQSSGGKVLYVESSSEGKAKVVQ